MSTGYTDTSNESSIELFQVKSTKNYGQSIKFPSNINDGEISQLLKHIGNVSTIGMIDMSFSNATLNRLSQGVTEAQRKMEHEIDLQDNPWRHHATKLTRLSKQKNRRLNRSSSTSLTPPSKSKSKSKCPTKFTHFFNPFQKNINRVSPAKWCYSFSNLLAISLSNCNNITNRSLKSLTETMPMIESINVSKCPQFTDMGLQILSTLQRLRLLNVSFNHNITGKGAKELFGTIEHFILSNCICINDMMVLDTVRKKVTTGNKKHPAFIFVRVKNKRKLRPMRTLHLTGCSKLTDAAILRVRLSLCSSLTSLSMSQCQSITDVGVSNILLHLSSPIVHLDFSFCPQIRNRSLENLLKNPSNKKVAGTGKKNGKLRYLKEFFVHGSGVNTIDFLGWLVESATELTSLGIGKCYDQNNLSDWGNSKKKRHKIGEMLSKIRRLSLLILGDEHVEFVKIYENETKVQCDSDTICVFDSVISRSLSENQYLQFKYGEHSFTYKLPDQHPENIIQKAVVRTKQSTTPTGCNHRNSNIAINGILKGFYGDTIIDKNATTTITSLEKQAWWSVDLGKTEKVGIVKILLPEQHPPTFLLPNQFPFWIFCFVNKDSCKMLSDDAKCPSNALSHHSVFSYRVEWDSSCIVGRSVWIKIPDTTPSFSILRIQQETSPNVSGRCLSLCEVQVLPLRLQRIEYGSSFAKQEPTLVSVDAHIVKHNPHIQNNSYIIQQEKRKR